MNAQLTARDAYTVMLKSYPDVLDIQQVAKVLGVSTKTSYRLLREGAINHLKIGRNYRIPKAYLLRFLHSDNTVCHQ